MWLMVWGSLGKWVRGKKKIELRNREDWVGPIQNDSLYPSTIRLPLSHVDYGQPVMS